MPKNNLSAEIEVAVQWWANAIRQPADHQSGDDMINFWANSASLQLCPPLPEEQIQRFADALKKRLTNKRMDSLILATDYHPQDVLAEAASEAQIDHSGMRFPIKTVMWIDPGKVEIRHGYGMPITTIYER